jgi:hypothetical protein
MSFQEHYNLAYKFAKLQARSRNLTEAAASLDLISDTCPPLEAKTKIAQILEALLSYDSEDIKLHDMADAYATQQAQRFHAGTTPLGGVVTDDGGHVVPLHTTDAPTPLHHTTTTPHPAPDSSMTPRPVPTPMPAKAKPRLIIMYVDAHHAAPNTVPLGMAPLQPTLMTPKEPVTDAREGDADVRSPSARPVLADVEKAKEIQLSWKQFGMLRQSRQESLCASLVELLRIEAPAMLPVLKDMDFKTFNAKLLMALGKIVSLIDLHVAINTKKFQVPSALTRFLTGLGRAHPVLVLPTEQAAACVRVSLKVLSRMLASSWTERSNDAWAWLLNDIIFKWYVSVPVDGGWS